MDTMKCLNAKVSRYSYLPLYFTKSKAIPVTGREGELGCETSRLTHILDNRLTALRAGCHSPPGPYFGWKD
jgi:hypothetical protein